MITTLRLSEAAPARYRARTAAVPRNILLAQTLRRLRAAILRSGPDAPDQILIEDRDGTLMGCFRVRTFRDGRALGDAHAARSYDLSALSELPGPVIEVSDVQTNPEADASEVLQAAWGLLMNLAERHRARTLLGCCAFDGTDPAPHREAFAFLRADHVAPSSWLPGRAADETVPLASLGRRCDRVEALRGLPPFLRGILGLGAWVSDHAVVNRGGDALDLLAILDLTRVPGTRAAALRAMAPRLG